MLYIFGFGTARLGEWRLNHIHSVNGVEVINASVSDSSAEIDYSNTHQLVVGMTVHEILDMVAYVHMYAW